MKECSYCGKEHPDEAEYCSIDGTPLPALKSATDPLHRKSDSGISEKLGSPDGTGLAQPAREISAPPPVYPEYQWSAKDAWKFLGGSLLISFVFALFIGVFIRIVPALAAWSHGGFGYLFRQLLNYSVLLLVAVYFARTEQLRHFYNGFGFDQKPSQFVWFGVVTALLIRSFGHFVLVHHWSPGAGNYDLVMFNLVTGLERALYLAPMLLLAPLFEEAIFRGFIYKAFRGSYPIWFSMLLMVGWTCYYHWPQYSRSWVAGFDMSLLTIVQCYLRERSTSLWDCIFCHFAFNASALLI